MAESLNLSELKVGEEAIVKGFTNEDIPTKFYEIGIIPGVRIKVYKKAPFNGPICFILGKGDNKMALRKNEAKSVLVEN